MESYKGCYIEVKSNNDINYPYIAETRIGLQDIKKVGYSREQAINLVKSEIDFILAIKQSKNE